MLWRCSFVKSLIRSLATDSFLRCVVKQFSSLWNPFPGCFTYTLDLANHDFLATLRGKQKWVCLAFYGNLGIAFFWQMPAHALTIPGLLLRAQYTKSCIFLSRQILWILCINLLFWPNKLLTKRDVQVSINLSIHLPRSKPLKSNAQLRPCLISAVRNLRKFFSLVLTLRGKKIPSPNPRCCGTDPTRIYHQLLCFSPLGFKNSTKRQLYA